MAGRLGSWPRGAPIWARRCWKRQAVGATTPICVWLLWPRGAFSELKSRVFQSLQNRGSIKAWVWVGRGAVDRGAPPPLTPPALADGKAGEIVSRAFVRLVVVCVGSLVLLRPHSIPAAAPAAPLFLFSLVTQTHFGFSGPRVRHHTSTCGTGCCDRARFGRSAAASIQEEEAATRAHATVRPIIPPLVVPTTTITK